MFRAELRVVHTVSALTKLQLMRKKMYIGGGLVGTVVLVLLVLFLMGHL